MKFGIKIRESVTDVAGVLENKINVSPLVSFPTLSQAQPQESHGSRIFPRNILSQLSYWAKLRSMAVLNASQSFSGAFE